MFPRLAALVACFVLPLVAMNHVTGEASGAIIVRNDDFSTNTRNDYTDLDVYLSPVRLSTDWTVSGGTLNLVGTRNGMLAIEDGSGGLLPTPDHFSIEFSFAPSPIDSQDHPGIAFDRNGTNARVFYLRTHSNQAVIGFTTSPSGISVTATGTAGLAVGTSYDVVFDVDYLTQTAQVDVFPFGGGPLVTTASFSGATFVSNFGANTGGAFGLVGFASENGLIDDLVVTDFTKTFDPNAVPEPSTSVLLCLGMFGLVAHQRRRRKIGEMRS